MDSGAKEVSRSERSTDASANKRRKKSEIEEMLEAYVMQCERAMQTGKREDHPKYLQTKLAEQKLEREIKALERPSSRPKTAVKYIPRPLRKQAHLHLQQQ